jgi:23S rRNA (cytidine1920-2'-O)/16S rRNA (cytidine1409-2'-O)-methyltransferase
MQKKRLDLYLVEKGLIESRSLAQRMIMAGEVRVNGTIIDKPSYLMNEMDQVMINPLPRFVSRGGEKLEKALIAFGLVDISGFICADVGSSTGGFTDCLLQHGAAKVYAIDVGKGLLHWKLRKDSRIVTLEETNARYLTSFPEKFGLVTIDTSFISLKVLLPVVRNWQEPEGKIISLVKPQFEAGREISAKGKGVIRDAKIHQSILHNIIQFAIEAGFEPLALTDSPILGPKGNREFLLYLKNSIMDRNNPAEIIENLVFHNPLLQFPA